MAFLTSAMLLASISGDVLAVLAGDVASDKRVALRLWRIPERTSLNPIEIANRRVHDAFVMKHPEIRVRGLSPLQIQGPIGCRAGCWKSI